MTRKDFTDLAAALAPLCPTRPNEVEYLNWLKTVNNVADVCERSNSAFDRKRFAVACYGH